MQALEERIQDTTTSQFREIVQDELVNADDSDFYNATIADIIDAAVHIANENKPKELESIIDSEKIPEVKETGLLKKVGYAGLKLLEYAMIPIKKLYNYVKQVLKISYHRKAVKKALKNPDTRMSELNKKTNYPIEKIKDRVYTAIAYIAAKINEAVKSRFVKEKIITEPKKARQYPQIYSPPDIELKKIAAIAAAISTYMAPKQSKIAIYTKRPSSWWTAHGERQLNRTIHLPRQNEKNLYLGNDCHQFMLRKY